MTDTDWVKENCNCVNFTASFKVPSFLFRVLFLLSSYLYLFSVQNHSFYRIMVPYDFKKPKMKLICIAFFLFCICFIGLLWVLRLETELPPAVQLMPPEDMMTADTYAGHSLLADFESRDIRMDWLHKMENRLVLIMQHFCPKNDTRIVCRANEAARDCKQTSSIPW